MSNTKDGKPGVIYGFSVGKPIDYISLRDFYLDWEI